MASDSGDQCLQFLTASVDIVLNPPNYRLVYFTLATNVYFISPNYLRQKNTF